MANHGGGGLGDAGRLHSFIKNLTYVNDPAERSIKLAQDIIGEEQNEEDLQAKYVVVAEHRKKIKVTKKGRKIKDSLKRMGGV